MSVNIPDLHDTPLDRLLTECVLHGRAAHAEGRGVLDCPIDGIGEAARWARLAWLRGWHSAADAAAHNAAACTSGE